MMLKITFKFPNAPQTSAKARKHGTWPAPPFMYPFRHWPASRGMVDLLMPDQHISFIADWYSIIVRKHFFPSCAKRICNKVWCASHAKELPSSRFLLKTQKRSAGSRFRYFPFFFEEMKSFAISFASLRSLVFTIVWHLIPFLILNAPSWNNV